MTFAKVYLVFSPSFVSLLFRFFDDYASPTRCCGMDVMFLSRRTSDDVTHKNVRIHDSISRWRWAAAVMEIRSTFGEKSKPLPTDGQTELLTVVCTRIKSEVGRLNWVSSQALREHDVFRRFIQGELIGQWFWNEGLHTRKVDFGYRDYWLISGASWTHFWSVSRHRWSFL